jgi:hypothetical protein
MTHILGPLHPEAVSVCQPCLQWEVVVEMELLENERG